MPFFFGFSFFWHLFLSFLFFVRRQASLNYGTSAREVQVGVAPKRGQWLKALWCCSGLTMHGVTDVSVDTAPVKKLASDDRRRPLDPPWVREACTCYG